MADTKKVVNINVMRKALEAKYAEGNRGVITEKFCEELGIDKAYFECHVNTVHKLYERVSAYCKLKNSTAAKAEELKAAYEAILPIWKELLSTAEDKKYERILRCRPDDVSNLIGFCQKFMNGANNSFNEEGFVATKVWATNTEIAFRKFVETDLGIRIAQVGVLDDDKRDFLTAERKLLTAIKKLTTEKDDLSGKLEKKSDKLSKCKTAESKEILTAEIEELKKALASIETKLSDKNLALDTLYKATPKYSPVTAKSEKTIAA